MITSERDPKQQEKKGHATQKQPRDPISKTNGKSVIETKRKLVTQTQKKNKFMIGRKSGNCVVLLKINNL